MRLYTKVLIFFCIPLLFAWSVYPVYSAIIKLNVPNRALITPHSIETFKYLLSYQADSLKIEHSVDSIVLRVTSPYYFFPVAVAELAKKHFDAHSYTFR